MPLFLGLCTSLAVGVVASPELVVSERSDRWIICGRIWIPLKTAILLCRVVRLPVSKISDWTDRRRIVLILKIVVA